MFKIIEGKDPKICKAYRCKKHKAKKDRFCSKHRKRFQKENNLLNYTYNALKCNAKRRGKVFTITLDYFKEFCEEHNYLELKGKTGNSASIDRKKPELGYEEGNLQVLSLINNSKKRWEDVPF